MLRMKTVTVMVDDDHNTNFFLLKIGDTTIAWKHRDKLWLLDVGAGAKRGFVNGNDAMFAFINAISKQFK